MNNLRIFFVGDRYEVLNEIIKLNLQVVRVYAPHKSYLEKELINRKIKFSYLTNKKTLSDNIIKTKFDVLVSNGCPYIIPVSQTIKNNQVFVNIHPSLLPDLRGRSPINGCKLFNKLAGATCHLMDDGIDTGAIISHVRIGDVQNIDLGLLYKICFLAEADAFNLAYKKNFKPVKKQEKIANTVYYTRKDSDLNIDFQRNAEEVVRGINAFGVSSQGAHFSYKNNDFKVMGAKIIDNTYLTSKINDYRNGQIAFSFDNNIVIKINGQFVELENISGSINMLKEGDVLV